MAAHLSYPPGPMLTPICPFKSEFANVLQSQASDRIAVLISNEYEGFSRNGGIGTYFTTLSQNLAEAGWTTILIFCQAKETYRGVSPVPALSFVFSTFEVADVLELSPAHDHLLESVRLDFSFTWQSISNLLLVQAIAHLFPAAHIYVEFPDVNGFAFHTVQAKRAGLLGPNCLIATTMHGCFEWVYEANDSLSVYSWFMTVCDRERQTYEGVDLAFFPSYFLKHKVESYGWKAPAPQSMPYFIPILEPAETTS